MNVTVVVGTFGGDLWKTLALKRAIPSAERLGVEVIYRHAETLAQARNQAVAEVTTEYVIHLDADDELSIDYLRHFADYNADVLIPRVKYVAKGYNHTPGVPQVAGHTHDCEPECLREGNYIVVGAPVKTALVQEHQWREYPVYEDYDLWNRLYLSDATFERFPGVYLAHVRTNSRNRAPNRNLKMQTHHDIASTNMPDRDWSYLLPPVGMKAAL